MYMYIACAFDILSDRPALLPVECWLTLPQTLANVKPYSLLAGTVNDARSVSHAVVYRAEASCLLSAIAQ